MTRSIICGVDGSESAEGAVRVARDLSGELRLRLVFVGVVEEGVPGTEIRMTARRLRQLAESAGNAAQWLVDVGDPVDRLVMVAEEENAALIVVGATGTSSSPGRSVAVDLCRRASCPIVVVPAGAGLALANAHVERELTTRYPGLFDDGYREGGVALS